MTAKDIDVKHYLFDFDGTLVDSMGHWAGAMLELLDKYGVKYPKDIISIITPLGTVKTYEYMLKLGLPLTSDEFKIEVNNILMPKYHKQINLKPFVKEKLIELKNSGKRLHVLTASPHIWLDECLKRNGIYDLFDNVWSGDDFPTNKSDPEIYRMVAQKIGANVEEIAFLDDNVNADKAAKTAGVYTIGVYDKTSEKDRELFDQICHAFINDFSEL